MTRIFIAILLIIVIVSTCSTAVRSAEEKRKPNNWQPIVTLENTILKYYVDANSLTTTKVDDNSRFNTADLMVSFNVPTPIQSKGKQVLIHSIVKAMVIECGTGLTAPVFDYYFTEKMPSRESKPIGGLEYPTDVRLTSFVLHKKSILYGVLCPSYI